MASSRVRETIFLCLSEIQSDSQEVQEKALQTLDSLTKVSSQNRNLLAQIDGSIFSLLSLSKLSSPTIQILCLSILFNLSLNPNLKQSLADMETIKHLNFMILPPTSPEPSKLAASLICSLAMADKNKARFGVGGTIEAIVTAVSGSRGPASPQLLSSLAELVQFHGNCTLAVRSGAVDVLFQIVESSIVGDDLAGTSLTILGLLARFDEGLNALRTRDGIMNSMLQMMKGRCMLSKEGAAEIILRLFDESEGCVRDALQVPDFLAVLADLSVRGSGKSKEKAGLLMKRLMESTFDFYADGIPLLTHR
ncbi:hypothetical protein NMG60_11000911 [Bertholletia excelsa]